MLGFATQHRVPLEFGGNWKMEVLVVNENGVFYYLVLSFPLPTLLRAGYSVKLFCMQVKYYLLTKRQVMAKILVVKFQDFHFSDSDIPK